MNNILDLIGRIFISGIFLLSGFNKIGNYEGTTGWMESFGLPGFLLIPAIILEIAGPILIIIGVVVAKVQNNLFVTALIKDQNLVLLHIKLKRQKKCFFVLANKLTIRHSVMDHIINRI